MLGISDKSIIVVLAFEIPWLNPKKLSLFGHKFLIFKVILVEQKTKCRRAFGEFIKSL